MIDILFLSVIGSSWTAAIKELTEHYAQREASCPVLRQVVLENLRKIRAEKLDEQIKVKHKKRLFYSILIDYFQ